MTKPSLLILYILLAVLDLAPLITGGVPCAGFAGLDSFIFAISSLRPPSLREFNPVEFPFSSSFPSLSLSCSSFSISGRPEGGSSGMDAANLVCV